MSCVIASREFIARPPAVRISRTVAIGKTKTWVLLLLVGLLLCGCETSQKPVAAPSVTETLAAPSPQSYDDPTLLVEDLNQHLELAGVPPCIMKDPDLDRGYAKTVPNRGAALCRFTDGTTLFILIVKNGEATYERHFDRQFGPNTYLWGPTWLLITSMPPADVSEVIRRDLGASG